MKDIRRPGKRHTLLVCLIHERTVRARDDLAEMFLKHTRQWTGFASHFGPPSGFAPKGTHAAAHHLFTVFGYGCNLGPAQTAQHARAPA